jgi:hypothetical protein
MLYVVCPCHRVALHHAAEGGHSDIVAYLVKKRPALLAAKDKEGRTPLHAAALGTAPGCPAVVRSVTQTPSTHPLLSHIKGLPLYPDHL